ncbi:MAG TPA: TorF family putative porin [Burkholderiales bacterium]|nr:TorF family putative porin [Burkholderiales bacterium]
MRKTILSLSVAAALAAPLTAAAQATPAPAVTGNMTLASDYRFRGLTQTFEEPALQGGFDYAHSSGLYVGNWNSSISETLFFGSPIEMDFYGGYKRSFGDIGLDVGLLYYYYPGSAPKVDNTEIYVGGSWKFVSLKYFHAVSEFFSIPNTKNSSYIDLSATYDLGNGWGINGHIGQQKVKNRGDLDYTDYKLGVTKDIGGWVFGAAYVDTTDAGGWTGTNAAGRFLSLGDSTIVLSVSKTF